MKSSRGSDKVLYLQVQLQPSRNFKAKQFPHIHVKTSFCLLFGFLGRRVSLLGWLDFLFDDKSKNHLGQWYLLPQHWQALVLKDTSSLGILPPGLLCHLSFPSYLQLECNAGAKREDGEFQLVSKLHDNIHLAPVQDNSHNNIHNKNSQEGGYKDHVYQTSGCLQCSHQVQAHSPSLIIMY